MRIEVVDWALWFKRLVAISGLLLALAGLPFVFGLLCLTVFLTAEGDEAVGAGIATVTLAGISTGAGGTAFWHGLRSLRGRESPPVTLPGRWKLAVLFGLVIVAGGLVTAGDIAAGLFLPPLLLAAAALPPLFAMAWFSGDDLGSLTWRRGVVAFAGGAAVAGVAIAIIEILLPIATLSLALGPAMGLGELENGIVTISSLGSRGTLGPTRLVCLVLYAGLLIPLFEEAVKPLIALPLVGELPRRETYLLGATIGAGFGTVVAVIYAGIGLDFWMGVTLILAIGGGIQPLGTGLLTLGWREVLRGQPGGWSQWWRYLGLAVTLRALWNLGILALAGLVKSLVSGRIPPPEQTMLILAGAGAVLLLLGILGLTSLRLGRQVIRLERPVTALTKLPGVGAAFSDRAMALWGLACLGVVVPLAMIGLQLAQR